MSENEALYKKEFTEEEIEEAKKHVKVIASFQEGQTVGVRPDGTIGVIDTDQQQINTEPTNDAKPDKIDKMLGKELRDKNNVFENVFGKGYGSRVAQIMNANIVDRFWIMDSIVSFANQDNELSDKQKKLAADMEDAFRDACCIDGPSKRLMSLLDKKPNLQKMIKPARLHRTFETIDLPISRLRFKEVPSGNYIPLFFSTFAISYGWENIKFDISYSKNTGIKQPTGTLLAALLAKYANSISPYDYANMWFVLMFVKNLSVCSVTNKEVFSTNPEILEYGKNLLKLVDHMLDTCAENILLCNMINEEDKDTEYHTKLQTPKDENDNVVEVEI